MKIFFKNDSVEAVATSLTTALAGMELPVTVVITPKDSDLIVAIKKMGTSYLTVTATRADAGLSFDLTNQEVAWVHKSHIDDVKAALKDIVVKAGGSVLEG